MNKLSVLFKLFILIYFPAQAQIAGEHYIGKRNVGNNYQVVEIFVDTSAYTKNICIECSLAKERNCYIVLDEKYGKRSVTYTLEADDFKRYKFKYIANKDGTVNNIEFSDKTTKVIYYDLYYYVDPYGDSEMDY
jgi:hypothetical protein